MDHRTSKLKRGSLHGPTLHSTPEILLTNCDEVTENFVPSQTLQPPILKKSASESSLTDVENVDRSLEKTDPGLNGSSSSLNVSDEGSRSNVVKIDIDGLQQSSQATQGNPVGQLTPGVQSPTLSETTEYHNGTETAGDETNRRGSKVNFLSGMAKTFHQWRTKTKKKRKFNYEKYIIYLESILPTVGFSIGGVIITFNGIYTFIVVLTFLVGVFAQEAFFGN